MSGAMLTIPEGAVLVHVEAPYDDLEQQLVDTIRMLEESHRKNMAPYYAALVRSRSLKTPSYRVELPK